MEYDLFIFDFKLTHVQFYIKYNSCNICSSITIIIVYTYIMVFIIFYVDRKKKTVY